MNRFPYRSKDRLGSQQPSPRGSLPPSAISFVVHVLPPLKLTPANIPAVSPASAWPTLVTITMLSGLVGLTATASSDSFRCRWLTSTLTETADPATTCAATGTPVSAAAVTPAITIANRKRYMPSPFRYPSTPPAPTKSLVSPTVTSASTRPHSPAHVPQYERSAGNWEPGGLEPPVGSRGAASAVRCLADLRQGGASHLPSPFDVCSPPAATDSMMPFRTAPTWSRTAAAAA